MRLSNGRDGQSKQCEDCDLKASILSERIVSTTVFDLQARHARRAWFENLVNFIDWCTKVVNDPLFCDIPDVKSKLRAKPSARSFKKDDVKGAKPHL